MKIVIPDPEAWVVLIFEGVDCLSDRFRTAFSQVTSAT